MSDFNVKDRSTGRLQSKCKVATAEYNRADYAKHKGLRVAAAKARNDAADAVLQPVLVAARDAAVCSGCGRGVAAGRLRAYPPVGELAPSMLIANGVPVAVLVAALERVVWTCDRCRGAAVGSTRPR